MINSVGGRVLFFVRMFNLHGGVFIVLVEISHLIRMIDSRGIGWNRIFVCGYGVCTEAPRHGLQMSSLGVEAGSFNKKASPLVCL